MGMVLVAIALILYGCYRWFVSKNPKKESVIKATLLYFDEDEWFCKVMYDDDSEGRGFVLLPEDGHQPGDVIDVEIDGAIMHHCFRPVVNPEK